MHVQCLPGSGWYAPVSCLVGQAQQDPEAALPEARSLRAPAKLRPGCTLSMALCGLFHSSLIVIGPSSAWESWPNLILVGDCNYQRWFSLLFSGRPVLHRLSHCHG